MKTVMLIMVAVVSLLFGGCIGYIPPLSNKPYSGKPLAGRDTAFIAIGRTTRAEVVKNLGTGYRDSIRINAIAYPWEMPPGTRFIILPGPGGYADWDVTRWRALFIDFDTRGIVTRKEFVRLKPKLTLDEQLESWAGWVPRNTPPVILP